VLGQDRREHPRNNVSKVRKRFNHSCLASDPSIRALVLSQ
jgi:hypothetical protein